MRPNQEKAMRARLKAALDRGSDVEIIEAGVVYEIDFACSTPGPEVEVGAVTGFWNGEIDPWGKLTIIPIKNEKPVYLFPCEVIVLKLVAQSASKVRLP
jgi:hypothetical protein